MHYGWMGTAKGRISYQQIPGPVVLITRTKGVRYEYIPNNEDTGDAKKNQGSGASRHLGASSSAMPPSAPSQKSKTRAMLVKWLDLWTQGISTRDVAPTPGGHTRPTTTQIT